MAERGNAPRGVLYEPPPRKLHLSREGGQQRRRLERARLRSGLRDSAGVFSDTLVSDPLRRIGRSTVVGGISDAPAASRATIATSARRARGRANPDRPRAPRHLASGISQRVDAPPPRDRPVA